MRIQINIERLIAEIENYVSYGEQPGQGVTRPSFSEEDYEVRKLFVRQLEEIGLEVHIDPITNIWGTLKGKDSIEKPIAL